MTIRTIILGSLFAATSLAAPQSHQAQIFTAGNLRSDANELKPHGPVSAAKDLAKYGNHLLLIVKRVETGSSELHDHDADVVVVQSGEATLVTGGRIIGGHKTAPGEIRGTSIRGGEEHLLQAGDVAHIPAGVAHQLLLKKSQTPFIYFVVKVSGQ